MGDTIYLLDYNRDLQEVFSSSRSVMDQKGILLGIVPEDVPYETNKKGFDPCLCAEPYSVDV